MKNEKEKIVAVVVTYNRKDLLVKCLDGILNQTNPVDSIILIDNNSTDGTDKFLEQKGYFENQVIDYVKLSENIGGAGGFYEGIKRGYDDGFDWFWLMDDDAIPCNDAVEKFLRKIKKDKKILAFTSKIIQSKSDKLEGCSGLEMVNSWTFVGCGFNKKIIESIGFPRKDFFIYYDDLDYSRRVIDSGFEIYLINDSLIYHKDWNQKNTIHLNILFKRISIARIPEWRIYYLIRNNILMYKWVDLGKYNAIWVGFKMVVKYSFLGFSFFKIAFLGLIHGIFGLSGKRI